MPNILQNIGNNLSNLAHTIVGNIYPETYHAQPYMPGFGEVSPEKMTLIPPQYQADVQEVAKHTGRPINEIAYHISQENSTWDPQAIGKQDKNDFGITQLNSEYAIPAITKQMGINKSFFEQQYGHPFDKTNPSDQIKGYGVYWNYLKHNALPEQHINHPTNWDITMAYNMGPTGYARYKNGTPTEDDTNKYNIYSKKFSNQQATLQSQ